MLRLDIDAEPKWIDLDYGVRIKALPPTTPILVAARNDAAVRDLPKDADDEMRSVVFAKAVARRVILEWEGVGDAEGKPVEPSPAGIDALIDVYRMFEAFQLRYMSKLFLLEAEKNASAPLPNGITAGAPDTAKPAKRNARNAPRS